MEPEGVDLLQQMLIYEPGKRISSVAAMQHVYFDDLKALKAKLNAKK